MEESGFYLFMRVTSNFIEKCVGIHLDAPRSRILSKSP